MFFLLILATLGFFVITSATALYRWAKSVFKKLNPIIYGAVFVLLVAFTLATFVLSKQPNTFLPTQLIKLGHIGLGFFAYFIFFVNIAAAVTFTLKKTKLIKRNKYFVTSLTALIISLSLVVGFVTYGTVNAGIIKRVNYSVDVKGDNIEGFKIALVSDLHIGHIVDEGHIEKVVAEINRINPDIVCIAGDIFDGDMTAIKNGEALKTAFLSIKSKYGVYASFGNHDAGNTYDEMPKFLEESGIKLLNDEYVTIDNRLILVGRRDSSPIGNAGDGRERVDLPKNNQLPVIVLDHKPINATEYGGETDLILSGHTHSGQIFPLNIVISAVYETPYGYFPKTEKRPDIIVTSGAGTWGPMIRIGSDNEVAEITLK